VSLRAGLNHERRLAQAPRPPTLYVINRSRPGSSAGEGNWPQDKRAQFLPLRQCTLLFMCRAASTDSERLQLNAVAWRPPD